MSGQMTAAPVMSFDPYHKWLGIPPDEQPPHQYRLLGIRPFESDNDVISHAADQRMAHVRSFQAGKRAEHSQRILNEVASARVCLLDPEKKAEYDAGLRARLEPARQVAEPLPTAVPWRSAVPPPAVPPLPLPPPLPTPPTPGAARGVPPSSSTAANKPVNIVPSWPQAGKKYLPLAIAAAVTSEGRLAPKRSAQFRAAGWPCSVHFEGEPPCFDSGTGCGCRP